MMAYRTRKRMNLDAASKIRTYFQKTPSSDPGISFNELASLLFELSVLVSQKKRGQAEIFSWSAGKWERVSYQGHIKELT